MIFSRCKGKARKWTTPCSFQRATALIPVAAMSNHRKPGGLKQQVFILTIVEMKKCKMKVSAGSVPSKGSGREPVPCLSLSFGRWLGIFGAPWLTAALLQLLPSLHMEFFPGCPVCPLSCPGDSHHWTEDLFHSRRTSS